MKNAETPVVKVLLYGAMSSLGSALMAEMLRRQHEVIAILDDLTALAPRPGLRTKTGDLFDAKRVKQSVAGCGMSLVLALSYRRRRTITLIPVAGAVVVQVCTV